MRGKSAAPLLAHPLGFNHMYDLASKYHFVFKDIKINLLLMLMEEYVNGAELQIRRIDRTRKLVRETFHTPINMGNMNWTTYRNRHLKICGAGRGWGRTKTTA
jgi:hypothetical protein